MSDLLVDFETLESSKQTADDLHDQFMGLEGTVSGQSDIWGNSAVAGAMHTFGTNWGYHREKLADAIKECGEKIESCLQAFSDADKKLAEELEKQMHEHESAPAAPATPGGPR